MKNSALHILLLAWLLNNKDTFSKYNGPTRLVGTGRSKNNHHSSHNHICPICSHTKWKPLNSSNKRECKKCKFTVYGKEGFKKLRALN